jgi:hypothetical protein
LEHNTQTLRQLTNHLFKLFNLIWRHMFYKLNLKFIYCQYSKWLFSQMVSNSRHNKVKHRLLHRVSKCLSHSFKELILYLWSNIFLNLRLAKSEVKTKLITLIKAFKITKYTTRKLPNRSFLIKRVNSNSKLILCKIYKYQKRINKLIRLIIMFVLILSIKLVKSKIIAHSLVDSNMRPTMKLSRSIPVYHHLNTYQCQGNKGLIWAMERLVRYLKRCIQIINNNIKTDLKIRFKDKFRIQK